ncbi:MAG: DUF2085 domain-containing protein [Candidatus Bathyarchaeia archaeon]
MVSEDEVIETLNWLGRIVCHQRLDRTIKIGGVYLPVCARDTGIYIGLLIGYLLLPMRDRKSHGPPNLFITLSMALPMIVDALTQLLGFRVSTNDIRLATGLLFGTAMSPLLIYSLPILPLSRRLPFIRSVIPEKVEFDCASSWIGGRSLVLGSLMDFAVFSLIKIMEEVERRIFYWLISLPIIVSVILHIFVLSIFLIISSLAYLIASFRGKGKTY